MNPKSATVVSGNDGNINSGSGQQYIYYVDAASQQLLRRGRDPRATARDHLVRLSERFVEPPGYDTASSRIQSDGCVLLTGPPGGGRHAAAQMLLYGMDDGDGVIQELPDTPSGPGEPVLDASIVSAGDLLLLDLSATEDEHVREIMRDLPSFRATVCEREARLAVVLPPGQAHLIEGELRPLMTTLARPGGYAVLRSHLWWNNVPFSDEQLRDVAALRPHLDRGPMRELAELARLVATARTGQGSFPKWLTDALAALADRTGAVAELVKEKLPASRQRALFLAAAMLAEAPSDEIYHAMVKLLAALDHPSDERPELEHDALTDQLAKIDMVVDSATLARFNTLAFDRAVRTYFWDNFPGLQPKLCDWVDRVMTSDVLGPERGNRFVTRFAEQALRANRPKDLVSLINGWTSADNTGNRARLLPAAALALEHGLNHQRHGRHFRRLIYDWANSGVPSDAAYLAIRMCTDVIATTHPSEALVRLHHLVRNQSGSTRTASHEALREFVGRDHRQLRLLLNRLAHRLTSKTRPVDFDLFLDVADPAELIDTPQRSRPLIADANVRADLTAGWRGLVSQRPPEYWTARIYDWLAAAVDERFRDLLLDVVVDACDNHNTPLSRLYVISLHWAREDHANRAERREVRRAVHDKIEHALGIPTLAAAAERGFEETTR